MATKVQQLQTQIDELEQREEDLFSFLAKLAQLAIDFGGVPSFHAHTLGKIEGLVRGKLDEYGEIWRLDAED